MGEDGKKWHNHEGHEYGSPHQSGDVIGAGLHLERQEIFFTCARGTNTSHRPLTRGPAEPPRSSRTMLPLVA